MTDVDTLSGTNSRMKDHAADDAKHPGNGPLDVDPSVTGIDDVAKALNVNPDTGLSSAEAARRLEEFGPNRLKSKPPVPKWKKFLLQFKDPLVYLLLAATAISLVAWFVERATNPAEAEAAPFDCIVIVVILLLNAVLGYVQENKAQAAVAELSKLTAPHSMVLRDGKVVEVATENVVPGDVLVIGEGDTIAADARLTAAASLRLGEASLTGESVPVAKQTAALDGVKSLGDRTNMVFNGTSVTQGTGRAIVTSTGMATQMGKIADMLDDTKQEKTPLEKEMDGVSKMLGIAVCIIAVVVIATLAITEGFTTAQDAIDSLLLAVSLAVAAVPEGLAAILTVVLALGVQRMAKHNAIVKRLSSVETLGSASVICSDKTGTLTRNEMTVETVVTSTGHVNLTGTGYAPTGQAWGPDGSEVRHGTPVESETMLTLGIGAMANNGELREHRGTDGTSTWECIGDPTEVSVIVAARKMNALRAWQGFERVAEIPFTSERKKQTVVLTDKSASGKLTAVAKGAPDVLLEQCTRIYDGGQIRPIEDADRERIASKITRLSSDAYRTLGMAYRPLEVTSLAQVPGIALDAAGQVQDVADQSDVIERDFIWAGMVGIIDPPRTEVRDSVAQAHRASVRTVMITGDHPLTAARIASDLGIVDADHRRAVTGDELDAMDDAEFDATTRDVSVYARVAPEHKLRIVNSLQRQGNIVAMTGDGVNDAPAVKAADIGVAMGITGTEVTKESAAMILADDNFSTIVAAVREGRVIFDNIRKFLRYLLSSNVGEVLTVFFGVLLTGVLGFSDPGSTGVTVPLLAVQLLWINLLTDAAPALAMGVDGEVDDVMARKPRRITDRVINGAMWADIVFIGVAMAAVTLIGMDMALPGGLFSDRHDLGGSHDEQIVLARTMGFTILVFAQLFNALASRSATASAFKGLFSNGWLWAAIALSTALQAVVVNVPALNTAFGTTPLTGRQWLECLGLAACVLVASELYKLVLRAVAAAKGK